MTDPKLAYSMGRNIRLYPWFRFCLNLLFWQAIWFLFFQSRLSAAEAVLLYAIYDVGTTVLEVPSGYMSDRLGRRLTLIAATLAGAAGASLLALGDGFAVFAVAQILLGASAAFVSGTDSAFLYESLAVAGRAEEIEAQETRNWRFSLIALALSAFTGGIVAQYSYAIAFAGGAVALGVACGIAWRFTEPPRADQQSPHISLAEHGALMRAALRRPVLAWLFALSLLMYAFSHLPFVFGQPFIAAALETVGWQDEAPLVSGTVSAIMMIVSVGASLIALALRRRLGLARILLLAFGMQIAVIAVLAATQSLLAIAVLFLRMVPNSFARPFIIARMQPLLSDAGRATFLSVQSLGGRVLLAGSLLIVSRQLPGGDAMGFGDIQQALTWYVLIGGACFCALLVTARRVGIEPRQ